MTANRLPYLTFLVLAAALTLGGSTGFGQQEWISLFDGQSLDGWRASEHPDTWRVQDGCLVARGGRSHLFYDGPVGNHDFGNFELQAEVKTQPSANSGIFFHTRYQESGWPAQGYEVQINNRYSGRGDYRELKRTGSLYAVRNIYKASLADDEWIQVHIRVVGHRIGVWINGQPTVDYLQPAQPARSNKRSGRVLSSGTIALQGHDETSQVAFRNVAIRLLPEDPQTLDWPRASDAGYGLRENLMDRFAARNIPIIDFHVHLRGGMTVDKAVLRQAVTGINVGVLRNQGRGWPVENDEQLKAFLDSVADRPVFVGLQVNDRDWYTFHDQELLDRLDFVLGDTMIMPMPTDDAPPVKLFEPNQYTIQDPEAWMKRYVEHNLRVLAEPITILANPTWLPPSVADRYDQLWTDERMRSVIQAAIDNHVALEINARSGYPHDRFIRMAKRMGAKFTFGTNNFDDAPKEMTRCFDAIDKYGLTKDDMYVPEPK